MSEDEILDEISSSLGLESWFEGKTLTVMIDDEGTTRFAKLRLTGVLDKPTAADLRGEPA
ncbi:hypothetical protein [Sphingomonas sp. R1]|uniref:hypothetical protein n=1 Tax=Sphingomonas sp. R1 TaxID=399176 RepID=UPI0022250F63|nr:hypothetical protein [Sphingomonas sp. R1]UYY77761.1 hypothetical protein OIM94_01780 [Sphingomonas sp. R1]